MRIAIVGGGPAGIFTALFLKNFEGEIFLYEQNKEIGEKLKMTGGGRGNVTNKKFGVNDFFSESKNNLKNLFKSPCAKDVETLLKELGIKYKWENDRAIFKDENAEKEVSRLVEVLHLQKNLTVCTNHKILDIKVLSDGKFKLKINNGDEFVEEIFDSVVLCTGGMFRIDETGSKNEIYKLSFCLGHKITSLKPALCPLIIKNDSLVKYSGTPFKGEISDGKNKVCGDILITHKGLSGPAVLDFSLLMEGKNVELKFICNINENEFLEKLRSKREKGFLVKNLVHEYLPNRLCNYILEISGISSDEKIAALNREKIKILVKNLFHYKIDHVSVPDYQSAWTTKGGVLLNEINVSRLESKLHKNLFFAGEMLDVSGLCGGYNVSFAVISAKIVSDGIAS